VAVPGWAAVRPAGDPPQRRARGSASSPTAAPR